ncbi:hypothetical protein BT69DRAFT_1191747, partial [Atractiella rhizophila]
GLNDHWAFNQHDKWGPQFGIWLHVCLDGWLGRVLWAQVWWTNSILLGCFDSQFIKYLFTKFQTSGPPCVTQSDFGNENHGPANAHTLLQQLIEPQLPEIIVHRWCPDKKNIKSEQWW